MRLHEQVKHQEKTIKAYSDALREFRCHLALPKFQGVGNDYIQTGDVLRWIDYIENAEANATNAEYVCEVDL